MEETTATVAVPRPAPISPHLATKYKILDSFLLEPLFIIGVLVLTVVIIIIISHYIDKNRSEGAGATDEEGNKAVAFTDTNLQTVTVLLDNIGDSIDIPTSPDFNEICSADAPAIMVCDEEGVVNDKIMTLIPAKDFREFPKSEEDQMKMRRDAMLQMLALPPLA